MVAQSVLFANKLVVYRLKDAAVLIKAGHAKIACSVAICDAVKEKGSLIWPITERIGKYLSGNDATHCLLALFTADVLVINGGYRAHMAVTRKVFLNLMAYRFPPSPKYSLDTAHQAALRLIGKWEVALGKLSPMAADFENIIKIASLLRDRGFSLPYPTEEEIKIILNGRKGSLAISSEEELENETKVFLETKLEFLIQRGSPADLKGAKEIISILADFDNMAPSLMTKNESSIISNLERIEEQKNNLENIFEGSQNSGSNGFKNLDEINKMCQDLEEKLPELARLAISTNLSVTLLDRISLLRESAVTLLSKISTGDTNLTISYANQIKNLEEYDMISLIQLEENEDKDEKTRSKSPRLVDRFLGEGLMIEFLEFYSNDIEYTKTIDDLISTTVEQLCSEYTKESEYPKNDFGDADQKKLIAIILNHSGQEIVLKNINIPLEPLKSLVLKSKNACNLFSECKTTNTLSLHDRLVKLTVATW